VDFSSKVLEAAVREELEAPVGVITYGDLERVERLAALGTEVFGREQSFDCRMDPYLDDVWKGDVPRGDVSDLSLLARMPNLRELYLCKQEISDVTALADLKLGELALRLLWPTDGDWSPLSTLEGLKELGVDPERVEAARSALPEGVELMIS